MWEHQLPSKLSKLKVSNSVVVDDASCIYHLTTSTSYIMTSTILLRLFAIVHSVPPVYRVYCLRQENWSRDWCNWRRVGWFPSGNTLNDFKIQANLTCRVWQSADFDVKISEASFKTSTKKLLFYKVLSKLFVACHHYALFAFHGFLYPVTWTNLAGGGIYSTHWPSSWHVVPTDVCTLEPVLFDRYNCQRHWVSTFLFCHWLERGISGVGTPNITLLLWAVNVSVGWDRLVKSHESPKI